MKFPLKKNGADEAEEVEVFMAFSPEIEIVSTIDYSVMKQQSDYKIPDANSALFNPITLVRRHSRYLRKIKIKSIKPGTYKLAYCVECRGHAEEEKLMDVIVVKE